MVIGPLSGGCNLPMRAEANLVGCTHPAKPLDRGARRALQDTAPNPADLSRAAAGRSRKCAVRLTVSSSSEAWR